MSLAETLIGQAGQAASVKTGIDLAGNFAQGAELALKNEQLQQQKATLEQAKAQAATAKFDKVGDLFIAASKMPDGAAKKVFVGNYIPQTISALGLSDKINPDSLKMMQGDPVLGAFIVNKVNSGEWSQEQLDAAMNDPLVLANLIPNAKQYGDLQNFRTTVEGNLGEIKDAAKYGIEQKNVTLRGERQAQAQENALRGTNARADASLNQQAKLADDKAKAVGQNAVDTTFGKDYATWGTGGKASVDANIGELRNAFKELKSATVSTGGIAGVLPDWAQDYATPKLAAVRDKIRGAIQSSLRLTLGSQFTKEEGEAIFNRSFNPRLSPTENARRAEVEIAKIENMAKEKDRASTYWEENGTLRGFKSKDVGKSFLPPPVPQAPKVDPALLGPVKASLVGKTEAEVIAAAKQIAAAYKISVGDARKLLKGEN